MLKIIIVEDSELKFNDIKSKISHLDEQHSVDRAESINSAKRLLLRNQYDVMILDIKLPMNEGESIVADGGVALLREILSIDQYSIPPHIVGLTGYDDSIESFGEFFLKEFSQIIPYDPTSDEYWDRLQEFLIKVNDIQFRNNKSPRRPYDYDLAIVCALRSPELEEILNLPCDWSTIKLPNDPSYYYEGTIKTKDKKLKVIATSCPQMGMTAAATTSMKLISNFTPRYIAMTGICAGLKDDKRSIGDILVPDISYDYGSGKYSDNHNGGTLFLNEPQQLRLSAEVKSNIEQLQNDKEFLRNIRIEAFKKNLCKIIPEILKIHLGAIGSGSAVISDEKLILEKKETQTRRLIGIEMEIYGVFMAAHNSTFPGPNVVVMKSICDWGDNKKDDEFQKYASFTSAQVLFEYAKRYI